MNGCRFKKLLLLLPGILCSLLLAAAPPADSALKGTVNVLDTTSGGDKTALQAAMQLHLENPGLDFEIRRKSGADFTPDLTLYDGLPKPGDRIYSVRRVFVAVHSTNPLKGLSLEQLRSICSGKTAEWTALTGSPFSIHRYALALRAGPDAVKTVLKGEKAASFYRAGNANELYLMLGGNQHAISLCTDSPKGEKNLKLIPIEGKDPWQDGYPLCLYRSFTLHRTGAGQKAFAERLAEAANKVK